ncbi:hypothetical protein BIW11_01952, partial [Tropilaelaps mercedesae]
MEAFVGLGHGAALVGVVAIGATTLLALLMFLVFQMSPGPNYEEVFRRQREQLMAMDEPKQKKKDKPAKKNKDKAKEKKDRSATPTQAVVPVASSVASSTSTEAAPDDKDDAAVTASAEATNTSAAGKDSTFAGSGGGGGGVPKKNHHHDHVDFADKEDVKLVELDQPPKVECDKVLAANRHPGKPILVHSEVPVPSGGETATPNEVPAGKAPFIRANSFRDLRPMDEVELHHKKQHQSPSKSSGSKSSAKELKEQKDDAVSEDKAPQLAASPNKKQQSQAKEQNSGQGATRKENASAAATATGAAATSTAPATTKKASPQHEASGGRKERKVFSKKELRELINQIEQNELPPDTGEDTIQHLVDALLNHQNDSKEWRSTRQDPMQQLKRNLQEKEDQVAHLNEQLNSSLARGKEIHAEMAHWKTRCSQTQAALGAAENKIREESSRLNAEAQRAMRLEDQLREVQVVADQLRSQAASLESANEELKSSLQKTEEEAAAAVAAEKQASIEAAAEVEQTRTELEKLRTELDQVRKSSAEQLDTEKRQWEGRLKQTEAEIAKLRQNLSDSQTQLEQLKNEVSAARGAQEASSGDMDRLAEEAAALKNEVEQLKNRNNQLHEKNWATIEAMNQAEQKYRDLRAEQSKQRKSLLEGLPKARQAAVKDVDSDDFVSAFVAQLSQVIKETDKARTDIESLHERSKTLEAKLQQVTDAKDMFVAEAQKAESEAAASSRVQELEKEIDNLREEAVRLRAEKAQYSGMLTETEKMLHNLENSVEGEEKRWAEDRCRFEAERSEMSAAVRELESTSKELQAQLEYAEVKKNDVQMLLDNCRADL